MHRVTAGVGSSGYLWVSCVGLFGFCHVSFEVRRQKRHCCIGAFMCEFDIRVGVNSVF